MVMKAVEFTSKIRENKILIPRRMQAELSTREYKSVRVVVFLEDTEVYEEKMFRQMTKSQFLKGYADSDSIYDL
jgi:hypothetical protein